MGPINCYLKGCSKCGGDLIYDAGDWKCMQCGQYYYPVRAGSFEELPSKSVEREQPLDGNNRASLHGPVEPPDGAPLRRGPRREYGARAQRNINAVVKAKQLSDERWWHRNREIIDALDRGLSVREAATLFDRGERQIRVIRERLAELRAADAEPRDED